MSSVEATSGITTVVDGVEHLAGSRCACGVHAFPAQAACSRCGGEMAPTALPTSGTVWSWTVQHYPPKPPYIGPSPYVPFAIAYVDLGPLRVESPLAGKPVDGWKIGDPVELSVRHEDDGRTTFVFVPLQPATDRTESAS